MVVANGFQKKTQKTLVNEIESAFGNYLSPQGTPFDMRALPPNNTGKYNMYEVVKPFEVEVPTIAPAFGKIGLGTQYKTPVSIKILVKREILKPI